MDLLQKPIGILSMHLLKRPRGEEVKKRFEVFVVADSTRLLL